MTKQKKSIVLLLITVIFVLIVSCKTVELYNRQNPYPNMEIVNYGNNNAYVFKNEASDKLIIIIEGSGWDSVLGIKTDEGWTNTGMGVQLLQVLGDKYSIMIPEKLKRQPSQNYFSDMEDRANYTSEKLLDSYVNIVNRYLSEYLFSSVIIIGFSEGACLLPLVYERLESKDKVKALVSMGYGGFSWYESITTLSMRQNLPAGYKEAYQYIVEIYRPDGDDFPDSYVEDAFGLTYRNLNSFRSIRPFDYYKNIHIPVLFIHGVYNYNIPVESTAYIQENLPEKSFTYKYFPWEHLPVNIKHMITFRKEVAEWIMEIDK